MPRYFLNLRDGSGLYPDPDGDDFESVDDVRNDVMISVKQIVANALVSGSTLMEALDRSFEVVDEAGEIVMTISFSEGVASHAKA